MKIKTKQKIKLKFQIFVVFVNPLSSATYYNFKSFGNLHTCLGHLWADKRHLHVEESGLSIHA